MSNNAIRHSVEIVIVGGGAGGLELVIKLSKCNICSTKLNITLVDESLKHVWKPLYHEISLAH
jgi:NADH dehydrogenase